MFLQRQSVAQPSRRSKTAAPRMGSKVEEEQSCWSKLFVNCRPDVKTKKEKNIKENEIDPAFIFERDTYVPSETQKALWK